MLILGDEGHYHGRFPWVTAGLVFVNVLLYTVQCFVGERFTNGFSCVPAEITECRDIKRVEYARVKVPIGRTYDSRGRSHTLVAEQSFPIRHYPGPFPIFLTLITSMFLHGGTMHLIGNMWFLLVFGRNVECALDHGRFLIFYLACGVMAMVAHIASDPHSIIPCLGASGAISGVMGAYVAIHPLNKVKVWLGFFFGVIELPALVVVGVWFLFQYIAAFRAMEDPAAADNVAYWAHLGGFMTGLIGIWLTVLILKLRVAQQAATEEAPAEEGAAPAAAPQTPEDAVRAALPDPFGNFMPPPLQPQDTKK